MKSVKVLLLAVLILVGAMYVMSRVNSPDNSNVVFSGRVMYSSRIMGESFEVYRNSQWDTITIKGVNIGMAKPGTFPGEAAITEDEYYRWFKSIGKMNANAIRVYTIHPPGFYKALEKYNLLHRDKIYLFHGVWINEENLAEHLNAYKEDLLLDFRKEMKKTVDVVHGNTTIAHDPGHAWGVYSANISKYVIGWIIGIEWFPYMVQNTNESHNSIGDYDGEYFESKNAAPFEYWLAEQMDYITKYEIDKYKWTRPISFTNWVTTDILHHPSDSSNQEDLASVDPNVIYSKGEASLTGQFASYHIYPYYPDFLNYDDKYRNYIDHRGLHNNYAGYLDELHKAHRLPILVAEFGVPASRGLTHENPFGWNQGFLSEKDQGHIITRLFEDIMEEKMLGGLIFTWQDEWFKRTWNTMDYDNPDRRPFWSNAQTNEQQFGLLSFDRNKIKVDGKTRDWKSSPLYAKEQGIFKSLYVDSDERYLYLRIDYDDSKKGYPLILLDTIPNQGNHFSQDIEGVQFNNGVEFIIDLNKNESRIKVDEYYDFYTCLYAYNLNLIPRFQMSPSKNSGRFANIYYALNKEYYLPDKNITLPFSYYETGKLNEGNANPKSSKYDSLADYSFIRDGGVELRVPWLLIQAKDPSQKEFAGDLFEEGLNSSKFIDIISIGALYLDEQGMILDSFPTIENNQLQQMIGYSWVKWELPEYKERLKQSYYLVRDLFSKY